MARLAKKFVKMIESAQTETEMRKARRVITAHRGVGWEDDGNMALIERQDKIIRGELAYIDLPKKVWEYLLAGAATDESRPTLTLAHVRDDGLIETTDGYQLRRILHNTDARPGTYEIGQTIPRIFWEENQPRFPDTDNIYPEVDELNPDTLVGVRTIQVNDKPLLLGRMRSGLIFNVKDQCDKVPDTDKIQMFAYKSSPRTRPLLALFAIDTLSASWLCMPMRLPR